jgi:pimeloyl-ACP methyl ester carboxylesterase
MNVYFIPGLAADARVFHRIRLTEGHVPIHLDWLDPEDDEPLRAYARRMADRIDGDRPFSLVGLSFGGMLATEISRILNPEQVILISSIPDAAQLPAYYRWAGKWNLDRTIPVSVIKKGIIAKRLVSPQGREDRDIIRDIVEKSDDRFIRWAMRAILEWDGRAPESRLHQIHGTRDIVLPLRYTKPTHLIPGAGHLMVMDRAEDINKLLAEIFPSISLP